ncbi:MAG: hypothetical protein KF768_00735 [Phycisphaeraceae bacterium]|nr:hypothetical protein [Phycisphaeraceae bacterium]
MNAQCERAANQRARGLRGLVASAVVVLGAALTASGQPQVRVISGGPGEMMSGMSGLGGGLGEIVGGERGLVLTKADLPKIADLLALNTDQRRAAEMLLEAYHTDRQEVSRSAREAMAAARGDMADIEDVMAAAPRLGEIMKGAAAERERLRVQLTDDLRLLLPTEQQDRWEGFERFVRRRELLPRATLSGESVDIERCVDDLNLSGPLESGLVQALAQYDVELDTALRAREREREVVETPLRRTDGKPAVLDEQAIREMSRRLREIGVPVRDVNIRYARIVEDALPEARRGEFAAIVRSRMYPRVYATSHTQRALEAAVKMDDLTPAQREQVERLLKSYEAEAATLNERWAAAIAEEEKNGGGDPMMEFVPELIARAEGGGAGGAVRPTRAARQARRQSDRTALAGLREVLTPEQTERLPQPPQQRAMFMGGGGEMGDAMIALPIGGEGVHVEVESIEFDGGAGGGTVIRRVITAPAAPDE